MSETVLPPVLELSRGLCVLWSASQEPSDQEPPGLGFSSMAVLLDEPEK